MERSLLFSDGNFEYVLEADYIPPEGISRWEWEQSPDGRSLLRDRLDCSKEMPAKYRWAKRLQVKFKIPRKRTILFAYMMKFICSGLPQSITSYYERQIQERGFDRVFKEVKALFWELYREESWRKNSEKNIELDGSIPPDWVPLPLGLDKNPLVESTLSKEFQEFSKKIDNAKSYLELLLVKDLIWKRFQFSRPPYWEEKILWETYRNRKEKLLGLYKKASPGIRKAVQAFLEIYKKGKLDVLWERTSNYLKRYYDAKSKWLYFFERVLDLVEEIYEF